MNPAEYYRALVDSITDMDVKRVAVAMLQHVGKENAITIEELTTLVFGKYTTNTERRVRMILEKLTRMGFPIGSVSGKPGRWLCETEEERAMTIADLASRRNALSYRIKSLQLAPLPPKYPVFETAKQISWL